MYWWKRYGPYSPCQEGGPEPPLQSLIFLSSNKCLKPHCDRPDFGPFCLKFWALKIMPSLMQ